MSHPHRSKPGSRNLDSDRLHLVASTPLLAQPIAAYYLRNRSFLAPYVPRQSSAFTTIAVQSDRLKQDRKARAEGQAIRYWLIPRQRQRVIGTVAWHTIYRQAAAPAASLSQGQSPLSGTSGRRVAELSFQLDRDYLGQGLMTEALHTFLTKTAAQIELCEAFTLPENNASRRILEKLGFEPQANGSIEREINGVPRELLRYQKALC